MHVCKAYNVRIAVYLARSLKAIIILFWIYSVLWKKTSKVVFHYTIMMTALLKYLSKFMQEHPLWSLPYWH